MVSGQSATSGARWELFAHGADIGVRGFGASMAEAFEQAALALTGVAVDPVSVPGHDAVAIACAEPDAELLLVDFLNAIVFEMATRRMVFGRIVVTLHGEHLEATAWGAPVGALAVAPAVEVKGATVTALHVGCEASGEWRAQCIVDV